jgi:hypothetical protein
MFFIVVLFFRHWYKVCYLLANGDDFSMAVLIFGLFGEYPPGKTDRDGSLWLFVWRVSGQKFIVEPAK